RERADRRGDGGDDGVLRRGADRVRHGEGRGARRRGRARHAGEEGDELRAAVLTISTRVSRGDTVDASGPALVELCREAGLEVVHETVTDDRAAIADALRRLADQDGMRFVFTTGGTGMTN